MSEYVTPEELLEHRAWLGTLARSLVSDAADADDLLQDTWVAALSRPPERGPGLKAWLRTVLRNRHRERHRRSVRASERERATARSDRIPATLDVVERAEIQTRLGHLVLELPEPDRRVLLLRFFDGCGPYEIATQLDIPVETVRTRIRRALQRLRGRLDAEFRRDGRNWRLVLLPLTVPAGRVGRVETGAVLTTGVTIMASKAFIGVAAATTLALLGWALVSSTSAPAPGRDAASAGADTGAHAESHPRPRIRVERHEDDAPPSASPGASDRVVTADVAIDPPLLLRGRFEGIDESEGGVVRVLVFGIREPVGKGDAEIRATGSLRDGFTVDVADIERSGDAAELMIVVDHPSYLPIERRVALTAAVANDAALANETGRVIDVVLPLERALIVTGRVVGTENEPVSGAHLRAFPMRDGQLRPARAPSVPTDERGRFRLRASAAGEHLLIASAPGRAPTSRRVGLSRTTTTEIEPLRLPAGFAVHGHVRRAGGDAARGARVRATVTAQVPWLVVGPRHVSWDGEHAHVAEVEVTSTADGSFAIAGLGATPYRLGADVDGCSPDLLESIACDVVPPATEVELIVDGATLVVEGLLGGRPAAGLRLGLLGESHAGVLELDENGRTTCLCRPDERYWLSTAHPGFERYSEEVVMPARGETVAVHFDLRPRQKGVRVPVEFTGASTTNLADVLLRLFPLDVGNGPGMLHARAWRDEDGVFRTTEIPAGLYRVVARPGATSFHVPGFYADAEARLTVPADGTAPAPLRLELRPAGRLRLGVRLPDGSFAAATCVLRDAEGRAVEITATTRDTDVMTTSTDRLLPGRNEIAPALVAGRYSVEIGGAGIRTETFHVELRAGELTDVIHDATTR